MSNYKWNIDFPRSTTVGVQLLLTTVWSLFLHPPSCYNCWVTPHYNCKRPLFRQILNLNLNATVGIIGVTCQIKKINPEWPVNSDLTVTFKFYCTSVLNNHVPRSAVWQIKGIIVTGLAKCDRKLCDDLFLQIIFLASRINWNKQMKRERDSVQVNYWFIKTLFHCSFSFIYIFWCPTYDTLKKNENEILSKALEFSLMLFDETKQCKGFWIKGLQSTYS